MKYSIAQLRSLTDIANARRALDEQRRLREEADLKLKQEAAEELEFKKEASAILDMVLDKAHEAASKGLHAVSAYEIPNNQIDFDTSPLSNGMHITVNSGYYGRDMVEHEYVLAGPLKVAVRSLKEQTFKVVVRRTNATNFTSGGSVTKYVLEISW